MPRAKTWAELTRRQRDYVRSWVQSFLDAVGDSHQCAEALRAALKQLSEPGKG